MTIPSAEGFLPAASCLPCTAEEERAAVEALTRDAEANVKDGDLRYLVSQRWPLQLPTCPCIFPSRLFACSSNVFVFPVDNTDAFADLTRGAIYGLDWDMRSDAFSCDTDSRSNICNGLGWYCWGH
jgi:hypothetical protein